MTQKEWVLKEFNKYGFVTRNKALDNFISRLGAIIHDLKTNDNMDIISESKGKDFVYKIVKKKPQKMEKEVSSPFDILSAIPHGNKRQLFSKEEVEKHLNIYLLLQWAKSSPVLVGIAEYLNNNWTIKLYDAYLIIFNIIPEQLKYVRFVSSQKLKKDEDIELIQKHFMCNRKTAESYLNLLTDKEFKYIQRLYKYGRTK